MNDPSLRPAFAPTHSNWDRRLTLLATGLMVVTLLRWAAAAWQFIGNGTSPGFTLFAQRASVELVLIALVIALLPEIISGVPRARIGLLKAVFMAGAVLGVASAGLALGKAVIAYGNPGSGYFDLNFFDHLASIGFPLVVAALGFVAVSDSRFVPGLGGFRPPPPRRDQPN